MVEPRSRPGGAGAFQYTGVLFSDGSLSTRHGIATNRSRSPQSGDPGLARGDSGNERRGRRLLIVPPNLAYGSASTSRDPANSTLVFVVDLIKVN